SDARQQHRRSIYIFVKRSLAVPELDLLDAPDTTSSCEQRPVSTTAPQALTILNGEFANEMARAFTARLEREVASDPAAEVRRAFELALCRPGRVEEVQSCLEFLGQQGQDAHNALAALCLVLLNTSEFMYVN